MGKIVVFGTLTVVSFVALVWLIVYDGNHNHFHVPGEAYLALGSGVGTFGTITGLAIRKHRAKPPGLPPIGSKSV
jgi:hypothetical protein